VQPLTELKRGYFLLAVVVAVLALFFCQFFYKDGFRNGYSQSLTDISNCLEKREEKGSPSHYQILNETCISIARRDVEE